MTRVIQTHQRESGELFLYVKRRSYKFKDRKNSKLRLLGSKVRMNIHDIVKKEKEICSSFPAVLLKVLANAQCLVKIE